jgi:lipid-A-disaccharide synthase
MIGIICGGGDYPRLVVDACVKKRLNFCLIFLNGFCSKENWPESASISINLGEIGKAVSFLNGNKVKKIVFAGRVRRPNFSRLSIDKKGSAWLLKLGKSTFAGDDALLRALTNLIQEEGFEVISGADLLDDIFLSEGVFSERKPSAQDWDDIHAGLSAAKKIGISDLGQSVIVHDGNVLGEEDEDGTDALITKCGRRRGKGGILVKISKPQQDCRLDLPTIGVETIETLHKNGFHGVAVEAGKCIVINKKDVIKRADELNIFIAAVKASVLKIFIIAGEASGDYLGGKLMGDILEISNGNAEFTGIGGPCMEKFGLNKIFSIAELSIMGIWEVVGKIFHVKKLIDKTVEAILDYQPDVIVTIDSSGFTHRVAKKVKKIGCEIPIVHYVAPPVWAWRQWRAKSMHKFIDKLMTLFPFEPAYFEKHGLKTVFVGHPVASDSDFDRPSDSELQNFSICSEEERKKFKIVTLLPGSRISEITHHISILEKFAQLMINRHKNVKFIIPTVENLEQKIHEMTRSWPTEPIIVTQKSQKVLAYYSSDIAVAASGTVTLELARVGLPFIVIYKTSPLTYLVVKFLIKVHSVCIVNLLAKKNVVPELLQNDCTAENIFTCAERILTTPYAEKQKGSFKRVVKLLGANSKKAAQEVISSKLMRR